MARPVVVIGSGGRIGRLLRHVWPQGAIWLTRKDWDVLTPPPDLPHGAVILDLAGMTQGDLSLNPRLAEGVARAASAIGARVMHVSSASVYPGGSLDMSETTPLAPPSPYGDSKRNAETAMRKFAPDSVILRLGNVAGIDALLGPRVAGRPILLDPIPDGDRGPIRSYIGPTVLARALHDLCNRASKDQGLPTVMNLSQPGPVAMADLLDAAGLAWSFGPTRPKVVARVVLSTKLQSAYLDVSKATATSLVKDLRAFGQWP